ncbi:MAG: choice-of-anchor D domain-containing protein [Deltaproteobacteria bacterium]|nr:choice-of-anchor D domain-containing protein [Deltaproteobacteria bacterium]
MGKLLQAIPLASLFACSGPDPSTLTVSPLDLDFGVAELGAPPRAVFVHLEVRGEAPIEVTRFELASPSGEVSLPAPGTGRIEASESRNVRVLISPNQEGEIAAQVTVEADDGQPARHVRIHGVAGSLSLELIPPRETCEGDPASLSFGVVAPGGPEVRSVAVRSTGTLPVGVSPTVEGPFFLAGELGYVIEPGQTAEIPVEFSASEPGTSQGALTLRTTSDLQPALRVPLCAKTLAKKLCVPSAVNLGTVDAGTSTTAIFEIESCGTDELLVESVEVLSDLFHLSTPGFTLTPSGPLPARMAPGAKLPVSVEYLSATSEAARAFAKIVSDAPNSPAEVQILANARDCRLTMDPPVGYFHNGVDERQTVVITNQGSDDCTVNAAYLSPPTYFAIMRAPRMPTMLRRNGGSLSMELIYLPLMGVQAQARLSVDMAGQPTVGFELNGDPALPSGCRLKLERTRVHFGLSSGGSARSEVSVTNTGTEHCDVRAGMASGSDSRFSVMIAGPTRLEPNKDTMLTVTFTPSSSNRRQGSGTVQLDSNDRVSPRVLLFVSSTSAECASPCTCREGETQAFWRFDPPGTASSIEPRTGRTAFKLSCEVNPCTPPQVLVELTPGRLDCMPTPPACSSGAVPDLRPAENSFGWICTSCAAIVHFGGLYANLRVCAPEPDLSCPAGESPTYDAESYQWKCAPTCDNGAYDQRDFDGQLVCVPC